MRRQHLESSGPAVRQAATREVWKGAAEWARESSRQAADHIPVKLRAIGFEAGPRSEILEVPSADLQAILTKPGKDQPPSREIAMLSEMEHDRWCAERLLEGWLPPEGPALDDWMEPRGEVRKKNRNNLKKKKLHGDLVPYAALGSDEQRKDVGQICGIPVFLANVGRPVQRIEGSPPVVPSTPPSPVS